MKKRMRFVMRLSVFFVIFAACTMAADYSTTGKWSMVANKDYQFRLDLIQTGSSISGTMTRTNGDEPVDEINGQVFENGAIQFKRDRPGSWAQMYTGTLTGEGNSRKIQGTFSHDGAGAYPWTAAILPSYDLNGRWRMVANTQFQFNLDITQTGNSISGTMTRTNGNEPVDTINGWIDTNGKVEFTRARAGSWTQIYTGQVAGSGSSQSIQGTFTHDGKGEYPWTAFYIL